ncbi:MAG: hypothetical protein IT578_02045 [Verrucomicrobiae bacterium]|nr:hypothetical protein [Verrucomicrobiae bacterium]
MIPASTLLLCFLAILLGGIGAAAAFAISCLGGITAACRAHPMPWGAALRSLLRPDAASRNQSAVSREP